MKKLLLTTLVAATLTLGTAEARTMNRNDMFQKSLTEAPEAKPYIKSDNYFLVPAYKMENLVHNARLSFGGKPYNYHTFNCQHMADKMIAEINKALKTESNGLKVSVGILNVKARNEVDTHALVLIVTDNNTIAYDPQTKEFLTIAEVRKLYKINSFIMY